MKSPMIAALVLTLGACTTSAPTTLNSAAKTSAGLPNPASVYCAQEGGRLDLRPDSNGNIGGVCVFAGGRECEEWALFRDHQCIAPHTTAPAASTSKP